MILVMGVTWSESWGGGASSSKTKNAITINK